MKRVKIKKKSNESKLIKKASYEAVEFVVTMSEAILRCDFGFDNERIKKYKDKLDHYSAYVADGTLNWEEIGNIIKKRENENVRK